MSMAIRILLLSLLLGGCNSQLSHERITGHDSQARPGELLQSASDRMATLAMRDNLNSLYRLLDKLYQRNPREWRKTGLGSREASARRIHQAIEQRQRLPELGPLQDVEALRHALSSEFNGDRAGAFIYALGNMLVTAHGGRSEFYLTDPLDAQLIHNAARNVEIAAWLLAQRQDDAGQPLLLSNQGGNLSYAVEFGKITARLDLLAHVLEERFRRIGVNYVQNMLLLNFLPVQ